jgi:hypothetical protein
MRGLAKLLLLLSILLMPLGMGTAAASTAATDQHRMTAIQAVGHCPDQSSKHDHGGGVATCSMACASALPAQDRGRDNPPMQHPKLVVPMIGRTLTSVQQEIATPPPKIA